MVNGYTVKLCGTTTVEDARLAAREGADSFGVVVEVEFSPRSLTIDQARALFRSPPIPAVALVYHMPEDRLEHLAEELAPFAVQFLSQEEPGVLRRFKAKHPGIEVWQSIHLPAAGEPAELGKAREAVRAYTDAGADVLLFDTVATLQGKRKFGGTGLTSDWALVKKLMAELDSSVPVLLAGGIRPENTAEALIAVNPDGIDLCSGVEASPGRRDPAKVRALMAAVASVAAREERR
ncbi:MAG: phosphoribosylanthranilate isomerase [Deltaproteobacteria bacterium]|nr:phosphoribosylanthranilate isomerase [Deltaproteobacteria bacterium]